MGARPPAEDWGLFFSSSRTRRGWQGCKWVPRRTETKELNSSSVSPSAHISFPSLSMTQLLYPFVLGNMATGAYKLHPFELSWVKNNMMTFSVQAERNLQKILLDQCGSVAHCQMISYYHVGYRGGGMGWGGILLERAVFTSYSNQIKSNWWWGQNLKLSITPKVFLQSPLQ